MEYVVEELDNLKRKLNITVPEDVVSQRVSNAYKELNRQIKMPGFRPGKIPLPILEKQVPMTVKSNLRLFFQVGHTISLAHDRLSLFDHHQDGSRCVGTTILIEKHIDLFAPICSARKSANYDYRAPKAGQNF